MWFNSGFDFETATDAHQFMLSQSFRFRFEDQCYEKTGADGRIMRVILASVDGRTVLRQHVIDPNDVVAADDIEVVTVGMAPVFQTVVRDQIDMDIDRAMVHIAYDDATGATTFGLFTDDGRGNGDHVVSLSVRWEPV